MKPLVSVICLCYNHEKFVSEALHSVLSQTYDAIEIIVIDDFSTDHSREIIKKSISKRPHITFIENDSNLGNCKSFNKALQHAKGKYVIDFATDDIMLPHRIQRQVEVFESLNETYGVLFTNAVTIAEDGQELSLHYKNGVQPPSGDVYKMLVERYFINPPTMMIRKSVLEELGGYDESLEYEDFDFWVRSSRNYHYCYIDEVLTKRRISSFSLSSKFYKKGYLKMSESTFRVIQKAQWLTKNEEEKEGLIKRIKFELRQAFYMENFNMVNKYNKLLREMNGSNYLTASINFLARLRIPVSPFYKLYLKTRN